MQRAAHVRHGQTAVVLTCQTCDWTRSTSDLDIAIGHALNYGNGKHRVLAIETTIHTIEAVETEEPAAVT